jgi:hypothetical protein
MAGPFDLNPAEVEFRYKVFRASCRYKLHILGDESRIVLVDRFSQRRGVQEVFSVNIVILLATFSLSVALASAAALAVLGGLLHVLELGQAPATGRPARRDANVDASLLPALTRGDRFVS